jgi:hypothetical protein
MQAAVGGVHGQLATIRQEENEWKRNFGADANVLKRRTDITQTGEGLGVLAEQLRVFQAEMGARLDDIAGAAAEHVAALWDMLHGAIQTMQDEMVAGFARIEHRLPPVEPPAPPAELEA